MDAPQVRLGDCTATLVRPSPLVVVALSRPAEYQPADFGEVYALAAASLIECWPKDAKWPIQPRPRPWRPGVRILDHGRDVFDSLLLAGVPEVDVFSAAISAYQWAALSGLTEREVNDARDFSGAPEGG